MAKRLNICFLYFLFILIFFSKTTFAQTGYVRGEVISSLNIPIDSAVVKLISSFGENGLVKEVNTDEKGKFKIRFRWDEVNRENDRGAKWNVEITKDRYSLIRLNIFLANGEIEPNNINVILHLNVHNESLENIIQCKDVNNKVTVYLFDLISSNLDKAELTVFLNILNHKLKYGITNYLESYNILGNEKFNIKRCSSLPLEEESVAERCCQTLDAPGIIWGYVKKEEDELITILTFTSKTKDEIITGFSPISYSSDIRELLQPDKDVDSTFLAFTCFLIGNAHLDNADSTLALHSFKSAKLLKKIPDEYKDMLESNIKKLEESLITFRMISVGGNH